MNYNKVNQSVLAALAATMLAAPVMAEPISDEAAIQMLQRMNEMERELSSLRGENEQLRNDLQELQKNQKDGFLQMDERIEKLDTEDLPPGISSATDMNADHSHDEADKPDSIDTSSSLTDPAREDKPDKSDPSGFYSYGTGKLDDKNMGLEKPSTETADEKSDDEKPADDSVQADEDKTDKAAADKSKTGSLPANEERSVYDEAFKTLLKDPKAAIPAFRSFLKDYPESPLAPSAQYWVGEALYAEKDFKAASDEFLVVLKDYKSSDKAPDAALKLGYSFYEMQEWDKARKTLEDVAKFFPDSDAAKLATERLDKMKDEGH